MTIYTKIVFKDYIKLMFLLTYRKPAMVLFTIIGLVMIVFSLGYFLDLNNMYESAPYVPGFLGFVFVFFLPLSIYLGAKRNFSSNGRLNERIKYEFNEDRILITGESFTSQLNWEKTYKVAELNHWILIYQNRQVANVIPKESFKDQLTEFRALIKSKNIKQKLKK